MPGYGPIASYPIMAPPSAQAASTESLPLLIAHQSGRYPGGWSVFAAGLALSITVGVSAVVPVPALNLCTTSVVSLNPRRSVRSLMPDASVVDLNPNRIVRPVCPTRRVHRECMS